MNKFKVGGLWFLQILLALFFVLNGSGKILGAAEGWARRFSGWGYPDGFSYVIGGLELLFGLALLAPKAAGYGAAGLIVIMAGAAATHVLHGEAHYWGPLVAGILLAVVAYLRRPEFVQKLLGEAKA